MYIYIHTHMGAQIITYTTLRVPCFSIIYPKYPKPYSRGAK